MNTHSFSYEIHRDHYDGYPTAFFARINVLYCEEGGRVVPGTIEAQQPHGDWLRVGELREIDEACRVDAAERYAEETCDLH